MGIPASHALDFERPLLELEHRIDELKHASRHGHVDLQQEIVRLEKRAVKLQTEIFSDLSRWQVVQLSRHGSRPYFLDYVDLLFTDFCELSGDRAFAEDQALVGGFARFQGAPVLVLGHQKGRSTKDNVKRNFGMPKPEGYRKAKRLMELAAHFGRPILTFIDTPGAYPGINAEERGQAEAIAKNLEVMASLPVPIISTVIGEGGSGGALAIGVSNRIVMLENSTYSVISPEACSSILYRDASKAQRAADSLKLTARDLLSFGIIDAMVAEPNGGAHRNRALVAESLGKVLELQLAELSKLSAEELLADRYAKFRAMGVFTEA